MALPEILYNPLKEKLADVKVEFEGKSDVSLLDLITGENGWFEKSEHAKKIQDNNKDLTDQRTAWEKEKKEQADKIKTLEADVKKAEENQLSDADKKDLVKFKKQGMSDEMSARLNAFEQANKDLTTKVETLTTEIANEKEATGKANLSSAQKALDNKIITTLAKHKIEGTKAEAALAIMNQNGNIGIIKDDNNGGFKEKFSTFKDGKELESNLEKMVEGFARENEYLVSGTKSGGTGSKHESDGASKGSGDRPSSMEMMKSDTKGYDS